MRYMDLIERVEPPKEVVEALDKILDVGLQAYEQVKENSDNYSDWSGEDDADYLSAVLNRSAELQELSNYFSFSVHPGSGEIQPVVPYIMSAALTREGPIHFNLDGQSIEDNFDIKEFQRYMMHIMEHEAVHWEQRNRMPDWVFQDRKSGYERGKEKEEKTGNPKDRMTLYLSDPEEIMAYAKELSSQLMYADEPMTALKDIEAFREYLPIYDKYRQYFERNSKVMKRLLKNTSIYLKRQLEK